MAILLRPNEAQQEIVPEYGDKVQFEQMKELVEGHVARYYLGNGMLLIFDEDAQQKGLPVNADATKILQKAFKGTDNVLAGPVIYANRKEVKF